MFFRVPDVCLVKFPDCLVAGVLAGSVGEVTAIVLWRGVGGDVLTVVT